ncbi:uncharacterized protein LOC122637760 isoform X2 [Vespula pensylvanica]|uniref:uncharacterized protein LOC122637760 isoform X2 n=1 Tax=Vespula pensylvanica TaxID=30213 RepID=UPI001CB9DEBC|nr:uncharacterized protein LOC122637760 isoform X2 [Vespula pensylvanica]
MCQPRSLLILFLFLFFTEICAATYHNSSNTFLERCRLDCSLQRDFASCGKYKVARWLNEFVKEKEFTYGPFRIIRISSMRQESLLPKLPRSRAFKRSIFDTLDFLRENINDLLTKRAIVYTIENPTNGRSFNSGPMIMDEDELQEIQGRKKAEGDWRIFKKKKSLILPLLILLNLFKLKLLLLPIFLGVHFIKKLLVLGSLIAPSILAHLKVCKVQPHPAYSYHTWATAAEAPIDYPTGYGHEDTGWAHRNDIQSHLAYPAYHGYRNPYG